MTIMKASNISVFILFCTMVWCSSSSAQIITSGSLSILKDQQQVNMICDFENCTVDKHSIDYARHKHSNWEKGVEEIVIRFAEGYNDKANSKYYCKFGNYPEAEYTLVYHLIDIDDDQDTKGTIDILNTKSQEVLVHIEKANGSAGTFGSFFNLLGDAFENLGKKLGKLSKKSPSPEKVEWISI